MIDNNSKLLGIRSPEYDKEFWNYVSGAHGNRQILNEGQAGELNLLPSSAQDKFSNELRAKSKLRRLCTEQPCLSTPSSIWAYDVEDTVQFVPEGQSIPVSNLADSMTKLTVESFKLASICRFTTTFYKDNAFDVESHVIKKLAEKFAKSEDKAFILGNGTTEPTGLLHSTKGASVGVTTSASDAITYDEVLSLYFSVDSEYRENAVWIVNDATALVLRKLKDSEGNHLWNTNDNTIMDKPVIYCSYMPGIEAGNKCILFGDLSYYWIIERELTSLQPLTELYAVQGLMGIKAQKFLDAKLVRTNAVKALKMADAEE